MAKKQKEKAKKGKGKSSDSHGKKDVMKQLSALNEIWVDVDPVTFEDVPDGKYQIVFKGININEAKSSGRLQVTFPLKIVSGTFTNRMMFKHDGIDTEESLGYFKGGLARLGIECPEDMTELPAILEELNGTFASVTSRTKKGKDMPSIYFDKALDSDDIEEDLSEDPDDGAETEEIEETEELIWEEGEKCGVDIDGEIYSGVITTIHDDNETALITFDDGDIETYTFADLIEVKAEEEEAEEEEEVAWSKGDQCQVEIDGDMYTGTIKSIKNDIARIKFEDNDIDDYPLDDLVKVEENEEAEEVEEEEEAAEEEEATESAELTLTFDDDAIDEKQISIIEKLAKDNEFNSDDYETYAALLVDMGEYLDIGGKFKDAKSLINAIKKQA